MKTNFKTVGLIVLAFQLWGASSYAVAAGYSIEASTGRRWFDMDLERSFGMQASEVSLAALVQPMPQIPISLGARYTYFMVNKSDVLASGASGSVALDQVSLVTKAWLPDSLELQLPIRPYVKISYSLASSFVINQSLDVPAGHAEAKGKYKLEGFHFDLGIEHQIADQISIFAELSMGKDKLTTQSANITINGREIPVRSVDGEAPSKAVIVGAAYSL